MAYVGSCRAENHLHVILRMCLSVIEERQNLTGATIRGSSARQLQWQRGTLVSYAPPIVGLSSPGIKAISSWSSKLRATRPRLVAFVCVLSFRARLDRVGSILDRSPSRLEDELARHFLVRYLTAVGHCHARGVYHRDVKARKSYSLSRAIFLSLFRQVYAMFAVYVLRRMPPTLLYLDNTTVFCSNNPVAQATTASREPLIKNRFLSPLGSRKTRSRIGYRM